MERNYESKSRTKTDICLVKATGMMKAEMPTPTKIDFHTLLSKVMAIAESESFLIIFLKITARSLHMLFNLFEIIETQKH